MAFDTLSDRLKVVATNSLALCRNNWGANGLKKEEPIHSTINWQPTFFMKPNPSLIVAVEVADVIYPEILKIAAHDLEEYDFPISVYQAFALDLYQRDPGLARVNLLRNDGFGIITVDDNGAAVIHVRAEPLTQHISPKRFDAEIRPLTPRLKVKFREAYATYRTNVSQGLQESGQIIEALITCIALQAESARIVNAGTANKATAKIIDALYNTKAFRKHRATLGGVRSFARTYRNIASHPATTPKQAAEKIRKCRTGFFEGLRLAGELRSVFRSLGYQVKVQ